MRTETTKLPFGIVLTITYDNIGRPESGSIVSDLHEEDSNDEGMVQYNAAMDGIESLILALAMAEVDVNQRGFAEAIETAVTAAAGNY